ncbi:MAG TPA: hypothetical protein VFA98_11520 [Thermoanaerobaculia bacterium]|nr:hypothetical protein [Thermoanaerobaculia bacterium]
MKRIVAALGLGVATSLAARCASAPPPDAARPADAITPADFVAAVADVAAGRNPAAAEAGLVLKRIEFHLAVGTETKMGAKVEILLLDAEASRSAETSFVQELTLEIPAAGAHRIAPAPTVAGVREFVEAAMNTARDLARAAAAAGMPQRLTSVELTAKITRSKKAGGGISAEIPAWVRPSVGADVSASRQDENTVRMVFAASPPSER